MCKNINYVAHRQVGPCLDHYVEGECDFETDDLCGYLPDETVNDTFVWMQGPSGKDTTGPQTGDHTTGSSIGHYMTTGEHVTGSDTRKLNLFCLDYTQCALLSSLHYLHQQWTGASVIVPDKLWFICVVLLVISYVIGWFSIKECRDCYAMFVQKHWSTALILIVG